MAEGHFFRVYPRLARARFAGKLSLGDWGRRTLGVEPGGDDAPLAAETYVPRRHGKRPGAAE